MPRLFWSNLDFEYALRYGNLWQPPRAVRTKLSLWRYVLRCLPGYEEALDWSDSPQHLEQPPPDELLVWGKDARTMRAEEGASGPSPARLANDRLTLHAIEPLENQLPCRALIHDEQDLEASLAHTPHDWIIKHPLGVSGRERITGEAGQIGPRQRTWLMRRLAEGDTLVFEPRCAIEEEHSWHVDILSGGSLQVHGRCQLLVDLQGTHRGHIVTRRALEHESLPLIIADVLARLYEATRYEGPLSTDGFTGTLMQGQQKIARPVSEINARHTFGRMAIELARGAVQSPDHALLWWHFTRQDLSQTEGLVRALSELPAYPDSRQMEARRQLAPGWYRLPECVDPGARTGTALCLTRGDELWEHGGSQATISGDRLMRAIGRTPVP